MGIQTPFGASTVGCTLGYVWTRFVGYREQPRELPVHLSDPIEIAVGADDQSGDSRGPDEALVRIEDLLGPERQPTGPA